MTSSLRSFDQNSIKTPTALHAVKESRSNSVLNLVVSQGQLQIHTASTRGSFSIVLSDALRVAGLGSKVLIAEFLKGGVSQGPNGGVNLCGQLHWLRPDLNCCITEPAEKYSNQEQFIFKKSISAIWEICKEKLIANTIDRLVLDEIGLAINLGYIKEDDLISTLENRPPSIDVILTGPAIPSGIIAMADQVTELRGIK
tara:strand:- start:773 stop:1369 length:597 start_codon:yes stop_codon:yes gene_type:complete